MIFNKRPDSGTTGLKIEPIVAVAKLNLARFMQPAKNGLPQRALINSGVNVKGNLETDGELHIDGQIVGNVSCGHLVIGKDGAIRGETGGVRIHAWTSCPSTGEEMRSSSMDGKARCASASSLSRVSRRGSCPGRNAAMSLGRSALRRVSPTVHLRPLPPTLKDPEA